MAVRYSAMRVMMQFSGSGGAWTDVTSDVLVSPGVRLEYGLPGTGLQDRVAGIGTLSFALNNAANNSARVLGYYAPGASTVRSGFAEGIGVRLEFSYAGSTFNKFYGRVAMIDPAPGRYRERATFVQAVDWMDEAVNTKATQTLAPSQNIFTSCALAIIATSAVGLGLASAAYTQSQVEIPYWGDAMRDEFGSWMGELERLVQNERGYLYVGPNAATRAAGASVTALNFLDRRQELNPGSASFTLSDDMTGLQISRGREAIANRITVQVHPRVVDTACTTVLFDMAGFPVISPSEVVFVQARFTDPLMETQRVGALSVASPVTGCTVCFGANAVAGDNSLGSDLLATAIFSGNAALYRLQNNGSRLGYITRLQAIGQGIYDYDPLIVSACSTTSVHLYGLRPLALDLPYTVSPTVGKSIADWTLARTGSPTNPIPEVSFFANSSSALMVAALRAEPRSLITVAESLTGLNQSYWLQKITLAVGNRDVVQVSWVLQPTSNSLLNTYWTLGSAPLETTCTPNSWTSRLGY